MDWLLLLLLLLRHLLLAQLRLVLCHGLLSKSLDVFGNSHSGLLCLDSKLSLHLCDLLWGGLLALRRTLGHALGGSLGLPLRLWWCFGAHVVN